MSETIEVERWWSEMCTRYGQDPGDPDAFWPWAPAKLKELCDEFKAKYGSESVVVVRTIF